MNLARMSAASMTLDVARDAIIPTKIIRSQQGASSVAVSVAEVEARRFFLSLSLLSSSRTFGAYRNKRAESAFAAPAAVDARRSTVPSIPISLIDRLRLLAAAR